MVARWFGTTAERWRRQNRRRGAAGDFWHGQRDRCPLDGSTMDERLVAEFWDDNWSWVHGHNRRLDCIQLRKLEYGVSSETVGDLHNRSDSSYDHSKWHEHIRWRKRHPYSERF